MMKIVKYVILFLIFCNIPSYSLAYHGAALGSLTSYASSLLLLPYYYLSKEKHKLLFPFILLGILYYMLSGLTYTGSAEETEFFIKDFIRFMIVVVFAVEVLHDTSVKDLYIILLIGACSVVIHAIVFPNYNLNFGANYGRYSGFYLNPNFAASICLVGFALSYVMTNKVLRLSGQLLFTMAGIFTLSRSFILIWLILNIVAIYNNKKNIVAPALGALVLVLIFAFSSMLSLNTKRFDALESIFNEDEKIQTRTIQKDSRTETWALYTDIILDRPFIGNGYLKLQTMHSYYPGVHNSFLMVIGEAGILPFILMVGIYLYLLFKSIQNFRTHPEYLYITIVLILSLMVGHGYFTNYYNVILSMFLFIQFQKPLHEKEIGYTIK